MTGRTLVSIIAGFLLAFASLGRAAPDDAQPPSLLQFKASIHRYVQLHRRLEQQLPAVHTHSDAQDIIEASSALKSALRSARATAREGDMFTPPVGALLRTRIARALEAHGFGPEEVIAASLEESDKGTPSATVNERFSWRRGAAMWPCVIEALPQLPQELQYRLVGPDLVLVDTHADLVVDILRDALRP